MLQHSSTDVVGPDRLLPRPGLNCRRPVAFWLGLAGRRPLFVCGQSPTARYWYVFILLDDMSSSRVIALIGVLPGSGKLRNKGAVLTTNWKQSLSMSVR